MLTDTLLIHTINSAFNNLFGRIIQNLRLRLTGWCRLFRIRENGIIDASLFDLFTYEVLIFNAAATRYLQHEQNFNYVLVPFAIWIILTSVTNDNVNL